MDEKKLIFNGAAGGHRPVEPAVGGGEEEAQAQAAGAIDRPTPSWT